MAKKSQQTEALEGSVAALEAKLETLKTAKKDLDGTSIRLGNTYDNMDTLHVEGTKYDEMAAEETETLRGIKKQFKGKKDEASEQLSSAIASCEEKLRMARFSLSASQMMDFLANLLTPQKP